MWTGNPTLHYDLMIFSNCCVKSGRLPTFDGSVELEYLDNKVLLLAASVMTTVFDGVHCMVWSFTFRDRCYGARVLSFQLAHPSLHSPLHLDLSNVPYFRLYPSPFSNLSCTLYIILYITARAILFKYLCTLYTIFLLTYTKWCRGLVWCRIYSSSLWRSRYTSYSSHGIKMWYLETTRVRSGNTETILTAVRVKAYAIERKEK